MTDYDTPFGTLETGYPNSPAPIEPRLAPGVAAQYASLSDPAKASFREALRRAGYSIETLAALGPEPKPAPAPVPAIDAPAEPSGYALRYPAETLGGMDATKLGKLDAEVKTAFHAAGVPSALAQGLVDSLQSTAAQYAGVSADQRKAMAGQAEQTLIRTYGEERANAMIGDARAVAQKFNQKLDSLFPNGAGSAGSIVALANIAAIFKHRTKG